MTKYMTCLLMIMAAMLFGFVSGTLLGLSQAQQGTFFDYGNGFSTYQDASGLSGTLYDFGNGFRSYQDNAGRLGTIYNFRNGFQSYSFTPSQGAC